MACRMRVTASPPRKAESGRQADISLYEGSKEFSGKLPARHRKFLPELNLSGCVHRAGSAPPELILSKLLMISSIGRRSEFSTSRFPSERDPSMAFGPANHTERCREEPPQ